MDQTATELLSKVAKTSPAAGALLAEVPNEMIRHLGKVFTSTKPLVIAVLAAVGNETPESVAMQFRVPVKWVIRLRDLCLRALRQREVELWRQKPDAKPTQ